ncbi:MAG: PEP-utilizing enzyme [bacterium]|nr:PEP-utilizing enzyme [bacterium]
MFTKKNLHLSQKLIGYQVYQLECPFGGFGKNLKKNSGVQLDTFIFVVTREHSSFYFNLTEYQKVGKKYFEIIKDNPKNLQKVINDIIKYSTNMYDYCQKIPPANKLKQLSDNQLNSIYQNFHKWHHKFWDLAMTPNLLEAENSHLIDYVMGLVEKNYYKIKAKLPAFEVLNKIIFFERKTWSEKQTEDYYRLLLKIQKSKNHSTLISSFYKKYCWLEFNWIGPVQDKKLLINQINKDLRFKKDFFAELKRISSERKANLVQKQKLLKTLSFSQKNNQLVGALEKLYYSKAYRMNCSYYAYYQMERVFQEIAQRLHLGFSQVRSILPYEMKKYLVDRKVDVNRLNQLYTNSVFIWNGRKNEILLGEKAKKFVSQMTVKDYTDGKKIKKFSGQIAFRGKVKGRCKIINHRSELGKIKKGEIMVSDFTDPSLMPAIIKATAIVTNFGGMTCHAAIVSRELKIPCIIGTKFATKVLKDGDMVEVDANNGIVKKL